MFVFYHDIIILDVANNLCTRVAHYKYFIRGNIIHAGGALDLHDDVGTRLHLGLPLHTDHLNCGAAKCIEGSIANTHRTSYSSVLLRHNGSSFNDQPKTNMFCYAKQVIDSSEAAARIHTPREKISCPTISKLPDLQLVESLFPSYCTLKGESPLSVKLPSNSGEDVHEDHNVAPITEDDVKIASKPRPDVGVNSDFDPVSATCSVQSSFFC